jgi:enoyl-CoA hydratase
MSTLLIESSPSPGVTLVRLNRPEVLNALNLELRRALAETFVRLNADNSVRVIIIAGGERAFCAGADLNEYVAATPIDIIGREMDLLWGAISACRKPIIAAVSGHALGGGCELAMHADIIIAGRRATFGQPEVKIGIMPGGGATQRLTRAVGKFAAMKILLSGEAFNAEHAFAIGLISELVDDDKVEASATALAIRLSALPTLSISFIKEAVLESMSLPLNVGLQFERKSFQLLFASDNKTEGISARLEKREAVFKHT